MQLTGFLCLYCPYFPTGDKSRGEAGEHRRCEVCSEAPAEGQTTLRGQKVLLPAFSDLVNLSLRDHPKSQACLHHAPAGGREMLAQISLSIPSALQESVPPDLKFSEHSSVIPSPLMYEGGTKNSAENFKSGIQVRRMGHDLLVRYSYETIRHFVQ